MAAKPRIAIVGLGNLGSALAWSLRNAGYQVKAVRARRRAKSPARLKHPTTRRATQLVNSLNNAQAEVLWLCVPDSEISRMAVSIADSFDWAGKVVLHSSGALSSDELAPLRQAGAAVASVHPLMTFVHGSAPSLLGVPFAIEGDKPAVRVVRRIVTDLGGKPYPINRRDKAAYHTWGAFASPLLTALLATTEQVASMAGVSGKAAARRMLPILTQTVTNYGKYGAAGSFSGPIIRGDVETVRRHLHVLRSAPVALQVYRSLARAALQHLPAKNREELNRLLQSEE